jgi:hypothetical protein
MAQSGYTPILLYASGTATNVPLAANLTSSSSGAELALNYADGKLYYKNSSGVVTLLVGTGGAGVVAGSNTQVQFNNNGVFGASSSLTWSGTLLSSTFYSATGTITGALSTGAYTYGTLGYTDVNIFSSSTLSNNNYTQSIIQNTNAGTAASADFIVSNNSGTASTYYGDFGITSSGYNTPGQNIINAANTVYLQSVSTDLAIGTLTSGKNVNFYAGGNATAGMSISGTTNIVSFPTTGAITLPVGTTAQEPASPSAGMLRFNSTTTQFEGYNGTAWASVGGAAIVNDTTTSTFEYPVYASATSGTALTVYTSNAKYLYKPSTGELQASEIIAGNGIFVNSTTIAASYTIQSGQSAMSVGPVTIATGQSVTVTTGQRWLVF